MIYRCSSLTREVTISSGRRAVVTVGSASPVLSNYYDDVNMLSSVIYRCSTQGFGVGVEVRSSSSLFNSAITEAANSRVVVGRGSESAFLSGKADSTIGNAVFPTGVQLGAVVGSNLSRVVSIISKARTSMVFDRPYNEVDNSPTSLRQFVY